MRPILFLAALISTPSSAQAPEVSKHIQKIMAKADGASPSTAFKVSSVRDEYQIIAALGLTPQSQSLIIEKKPYDVLTVVDDSGETRKVWFDISRLYSMY